jgi:hypothetical protein
MRLLLIYFFLSQLFFSQESFFQDYQFLLSNYVDDFGRINYKAIKEDDLILIKRQYQKIKSLDLKKFETSYKEPLAKLSFFMNAYNFITIHEVVMNYPVNSIRDIKDVWKKRHALIGKEYSLDEIEHDLIRPFRRPECHFALICAAYSCPPLQKEVYTKDNIEDQFKVITNVFYSNPLTFQLDEETNEIYVSQIFNWYTADFQFNPTGNKIEDEELKKEIVKTYLIKYAPKKISEFIISNRKNLKIGFIDWNWALNEAI